MRIRLISFQHSKFMNNHSKIFAVFIALVLSLTSCIVGGLLTVFLFSRLGEQISPRELATSMLPILIGYIISSGMSALCLLLAFRKETCSISEGIRRSGIVLSWINSLNAFPFGLIAAFVLQTRMWKKR